MALVSRRPLLDFSMPRNDRYLNGSLAVKISWHEPLIHTPQGEAANLVTGAGRAGLGDSAASNGPPSRLRPAAKRAATEALSFPPKGSGPGIFS